MTTTVQSTTLQHPALPQTLSMIERIALPAVFGIVNATTKNPEHAAELKEYLLALRDSINAVFPGE